MPYSCKIPIFYGILSKRTFCKNIKTESMYITARFVDIYVTISV